MAKKAPNTENTRSSPDSESTMTAQTAPNQRMVLRPRTSNKMKVYSETDGGIVKRKRGNLAKKSEKFDAKKPKKPPTAFFYFLEDFRKEYQEQNPEVKLMRDIGKACGDKWKTMTYEEKVQYYDIATEKRAEFDRAMADYLKKKESGRDQESEVDSEFDY